MGRIGNSFPKRYVKKLTYSLCAGSLTLMIMLTGCGNQSTSARSEGSTTKASTSSDADEKQVATEKKTDTKKVSEIPSDLLPSDAEKTQESSNASSGGTSTVTTEETFDAGGGVSSKSGSSSSSNNGATDSSSNADSSSSGNSSSQSTIRVTMGVDGSAAGDMAVSMGAVSITLQSGSSVYDALVASGVSFSGGSGYVSGIGGLFEKDCGPQSGWTYAVNGTTPGKGCGSYTVHDGDSIQWIYVLSY